MRRGIAAFERQWNYDAGYVHEIIEASPRAAGRYARGDRETDRQVRLADPGRPEEDDILAALDESELAQALDLLAPERQLKRKSKSRSCLTAGRRLERMAAWSRWLLRG